MPTVFTIDGFRIMIYTDDHEPPHVHVFTNDCEAVILLQCRELQCEIRESYGCSKRAARAALDLVTEHKQELCARWKEIHGDI